MTTLNDAAVEAAADVLLVVAVALAVRTAILAALLIAAQAASVRRIVPWQTSLWMTAVAFTGWVILR
ncbi:hypothetical protein [Aeromicrobium sp. UC242_57]|uniref:hypothetical protein n=1 Tax=Aeromicrobium sp. UC242_57 TaxID=3374624 RepID=UPI0037B34590